MRSICSLKVEREKLKVKSIKGNLKGKSIKGNLKGGFEKSIGSY
jgi:hypothetical protein